MSKINRERLQQLNAVIAKLISLTDDSVKEESLRSLASAASLDITTDFCGADLSGLDLSFEDLSGFNLEGANLSGANLSNANLTGASLTNVTITSAYLTEAQFDPKPFTGTISAHVSLKEITFDILPNQPSDSKKGIITAKSKSQRNTKPYVNRYGASKIYVGGLPYSATEQQLSDLFAAHGAVAKARIITDKFTGQSRGFGFVEMSSDDEAQAAITALNGSELGGRTLTVNDAKPMEQRSVGGGGDSDNRDGGNRRDRW